MLATMRKVVVAVALFFHAGCVSVASRYFGEIEFTLENPTAQWIHVDKVSLDFGSPKINQSV